MLKINSAAFSSASFPAYLREGYSDAFFEQCRRMVCGGKDITLNYEFFNEPEIVKYIKINRFGWAGHVIRMDTNRTVK
jgi:hypothetical protein